jgi:FMN phosphatase YigB (HAD superfamily)
MPKAIGFDVYGTLVDPLEMNQYLRRFLGDEAEVSHSYGALSKLSMPSAED